MLTDLPNIQNVLEYIDNKYPEWVYKISDKFSKDYEYLNSNWCHMCNVFNTTPKKIIIVENMNNDEFYTLSELLTKVGFIIRSRDEYIYCLKCNRNLDILLHCAFFRCCNCKQLTRTTKIDTESTNNNEILQHLFKNNTQDQHSFKHYFNLNDSNNLMPYNINYNKNSQGNIINVIQVIHDLRVAG